MKNRKTARFTLPVLSAAAIAVAGGASAAVVWSDDFSGSTAGSAPTRDFPTGTAGEDYTFTSGTNAATSTSGTVGNPANSMSQTDTNTASSSAATTAIVTMAQFAPFTLSATTNLLRVKFDFRVDSFSSADTTGNPRFILRYAAAGNQHIVFGFGRGNLTDGDDTGTTDLTLYAAVPSDGNTGITPTDTRAIGLNAGTWAPGFDFGNTSATAADNDTNDQFYSYDFTYNFNTGAVVGTVTNTVTAQSVSFNRSMQAGLVFTNEATRSIIFATAHTSASTAYFDNIEISAIPEPSVVALGGLSLLGLLGRRR